VSLLDAQFALLKHFNGIADELFELIGYGFWQLEIVQAQNDLSMLKLAPEAGIRNRLHRNDFRHRL
jgi:hypothetical protein